MAQEEKVTQAPEDGSESTRKPRTQAPKTKPYCLKEGAEIEVIHEGEFKNFTGVEDGSVQVHLTEEQAKAFADKLDLKADPQAVNMKNATTLVVGEETGGATTITEAAAQAGLAEGLTGDSEESVDNHDPVDKPQGSKTADVSKVGNAPAKSEGKPGAERTGNAGAGQTSSAGGAANAQTEGKPASGEAKK
jgi:hypothetical protein